MRISFLGDIMIGRDIESELKEKKDYLISNEIYKDLNKSDLVVGNLEGPISNSNKKNHQDFSFSIQMLNKVNFVNLFSLANNHINDSGNVGLKKTLEVLSKKKFYNNGLYFDKYSPFEFKDDNNKIAIFCCTEFSNIDEKSQNPSIFYLKDLLSSSMIEKSKKNNFLNICFVHGGIMFTQLPNPIFREEMQKLVDKGADLVITVHPHIIGSEENYKEKLIIYSLGDFIMDGKSFDRRQSVYINIEINNNIISSIEHKVTKNEDFYIKIHDNSHRILLKRKKVSKKLNSKNYIKSYNKNYKRDILLHSISTLKYILINKGFIFFLKFFILRFKDFFNMLRWFNKDTSSLRNNLEDKELL